MNRRRVRGIGDDDGGGGVSATGLRDLQRRRRHRQINMRSKTSTTTAETSAEDRQVVQGIGDDNRGGIGSTTDPMDWKRRRSVDFSYYRVTNSNTVLYLSRRCLVLMLFSSDSFFFIHCKKDYKYFNHAENIFVTGVH